MDNLHRLAVAVFLVSVFASMGVASSSRVTISGLPYSDSVKEEVELLSKAFRLDKLYMSMTGPSANLSGIKLLKDEPRQLVWLTGIKNQVIDPAQKNPISPEFFCHANLTFDPKRTTPDAHNKQLGGTTNMDWRFFTLVPGRLDIELPAGFGMPVLSDTPLDLFSMSLNQNIKDHKVDVQFRSHVQFLRDSSLARPIKPLYRRALYVLEPIKTSGIEKIGAHQHPTHPGEGCGDLAAETKASGDKKIGTTATIGGVLPQFGNDVTIHWMVPPGRHTYRTILGKQMQLPAATTVHYATAHLHPFAEALELYDLTTEKSVFRLGSRDFKDRIGVEHMDQFSSEEGVLLDPAHQYELRADYNNPLDHDTDAMAILYIYLLEKEFKKPSVS